MKNTRNILTGLALPLLFVACTVEEMGYEPETTVLTVQLEEPDTRVELDADGKVSWDATDEIAVYVDGSGYKKATITPTGTTAYAHIVMSTTDFGNRTYYAVYPYTAKVDVSYGNTELAVTLPASYDISDKLSSNYSPVPMVAVNDPLETTLHFRHVGGLLRITCSRVPEGTRSIKVTTDKTITGTFQVTNPESMLPTINTPETTTNNSVVFTVAGSGGLSDVTDNIVLNVPVPCGTYNTFKVETFTTADASGTPVTSLAKTTEKHTFFRHHGWKMPVDNLSFMFNVTGPSTFFGPESSTMTGAYTVQSYKRDGGVSSPVKWTATFYTEEGVEIDKPDWLTGFTTTDDGSLTDEAFDITVAANEATLVRTWEGPTASDGNEMRARAYDLSKHDIYGNEISQTTANCYVVSRPGWYKFPCVYGNALKNGATNTSAYIRTASSEGNYLGTFRRHDDQPIQGPWITADNGITISSAELVWDDNGVIELVEFNSSESYIYFMVSSRTINQGNAVIAAKNGSGTVVWSWHIWSMETPDKNGNLDTVPVYSHPTNHTSVTNPNYMMKVNLGWVDATHLDTPRSVKVKLTQDGADHLEATFTIYQNSYHSFGGNPYYQWGRKDPMQGFDEYYQDVIPSGPTKLVKTHYVASLNTLGYAIQHPNVFYYAGDDGSWCSTLRDNLWNTNGLFDTDTEVVKTVYDPCPVGFKVPNKNAYTGFTESGNDGTDLRIIGEWQHGYVFKCSEDDEEGIFFPATSLRERNTGELRSFDYFDMSTYTGHYWMASMTWYGKATAGGTYTEGYSPNYLNYGNYAAGASIRVIGDNARADYGFSIRPVAE